MKGMLGLLEKAGLVRRMDEAPAIDATQPPRPSDVAPAELASPAQANEAADPPSAMTTGLSLEQIYATAGVPPSPYPAERLLRLIEGLKAMDDGLRRQTIQAIDAADDSWTLDDPRRDATAKVAALERHAAQVRAGLAQAEQDAQARLQDLARRQEGTVAGIRQQIVDLEGLLAREIARGTQEQAAIEASLQSQRQSANHELTDLSRTAAALTGLVAQLSTTPTA